MMGNAHLAFGLGSYLLATGYVGHNPGLLELGAASLGALSPDADHPRSKLGRWLPGISHFFYYLAGGHRGITHSLWVLIPLLMAAGWLMQEHHAQLSWFANDALNQSVYGLGYIALIAFTWGFLSHLAGDLLTTEGLRLFWPLSYRWQPSPLRSESIWLNLFAWSIFCTGVLVQGHNFWAQYF